MTTTTPIDVAKLTHAAVSEVQTDLNKLGAKPALKVDGVMGPATHTAIKAFQTTAGLPVDGVAGLVTLAVIRAKVA